MFNWHASLSPFGSWHNGENPFSPSGLLVNSTAFLWYDPSDVANTLWRRNLLTWTEQFDNAAWAKGSVTVSANSTTAPDGTATADTIANTNGVSSAQVNQTVSLPAATHTVSFWVMGGTTSTVIFGVLSGSFLSGTAIKISGPGSISGTTLITLTGLSSTEWTRVSFTFTAVSGNNLFVVYPETTAAGTGKSVVLWGAQLEVGSVATEYQRITDVNTEVIERFPTATLYQDAAGTTPVTAPAQPVGLVLDKSRGLVLGPELIVNGDFSNGLTGWTTTGTLAGGAVTIQRSADSSINTSITYTASSSAVIGRTYLVEFDVTAGSGQFLLNEVVTANATTGRRRFYVLNTRTIPFEMRCFAGGSVTIDNISVRELPGFHATQSTAASRPTYGVVPSRGRVNLLTFTDQFSNAAWSLFNVSGTASRAGNVLTFGANASDRFVQSNNALTAAQHTASVVLSGTGEVRLYLLGGDGSTGAPTTVTLTATPTRYTITRTPAGGGSFGGIGIYNNAAGTATTVTISEPQVELGSTATPYQRVVSQFDVTDPVGFPSYPLHYLFFDGVDDFLQTATITPNADKVQVFAGVRKLSDAAAGMVAELSADIAANNGTFDLRAPNSTSPSYWFRSKGANVGNASVSSGYAAPISNVLTGIGDISGDVAALRVNGTQVALSTSDQQTGNYLAYPLFIGRRAGTSLPFNGQLYGLITRFSTANLDASLISTTERWMGGKTGVVIT